MTTVLLGDPDDPYDTGATTRREEAEALAAAQAREREKQIDAQLENLLQSKDKRTLQEWAEDILVHEHNLSPTLAREIVAVEVSEWRIAQIPVNWNCPISKASRTQKGLARYCVVERLKKPDPTKSIATTNHKEKAEGQ